MSEEFPHISESASDIVRLLRGESHWKRRKPLVALHLVSSGACRSRDAVADRLNVSEATVGRWMRRYVRDGIGAFTDHPDEAAESVEPVVGSDSLVGCGSSDNAPLMANGAGAMQALGGPNRTQSGTASAESVVLLGEADDLVASIIEARLEREGMRVERARDGVELVTLAESGRVDLFLVDIRLSGLDGFQLVRWIRDDARLGSVPAIMLGWPGKETDVVDAFRAGADDFILKPFSPIDLSARVERLLKGWGCVARQSLRTRVEDAAGLNNADVRLGSPDGSVGVGRRGGVIADTNASHAGSTTRADAESAQIPTANADREPVAPRAHPRTAGSQSSGAAETDGTVYSAREQPTSTNGSGVRRKT